MCRVKGEEEKRREEILGVRKEYMKCWDGWLRLVGWLVVRGT